MGAISDLTWLLVTVLLTVVGAGATVLLWRRRGAASGLRAAAWTLLPAAAYLTGTLRLLARIVDAVTWWALSVAFSPLVWLGIALAGTSGALFAVSAAMRTRGRGAPRTFEAPRAPRGRLTRGSGAPQAAPHLDGAEDDLADVEAILRKHGIR